MFNGVFIADTDRDTQLYVQKFLRPKKTKSTNISSRMSCRYIIIRDFEASEKTRSGVLSGLKSLGFTLLGF